MAERSGGLRTVASRECASDALLLRLATRARLASHATWRRAVGIGDGSMAPDASGGAVPSGVALVTLRRWDWRRKCLAGRVRWCCAVGSGGESVALVTLCRCDWRRKCLARRG